SGSGGILRCQSRHRSQGREHERDVDREELHESSRRVIRQTGNRAYSLTTSRPTVKLATLTMRWVLMAFTPGMVEASLMARWMVSGLSTSPLRVTMPRSVLTLTSKAESRLSESSATLTRVVSAASSRYWP